MLFPQNQSDIIYVFARHVMTVSKNAIATLMKSVNPLPADREKKLL